MRRNREEVVEHLIDVVVGVMDGSIETPREVARHYIGLFPEYLWENPDILRELPHLPRAIKDWSRRALLPVIDNDDTIDSVVQKNCHNHVVVGLHGYMELGTHFGPLYERILDRYGVGFCPLEYPSLRPIKKCAAYIGREINKLLDRTDVDITIVGHSLGCLVALGAYYSDRIKDRNRVNALVLLGGPHSGTYQAVHGFGKSMEELRRGSDLLQDWMAKYPTLSDGHKLWIVYSPQDSLVAPEDCYLPVRDAHYLSLNEMGVSGHTSHLGFLYRREIVHAVGNLVRSGELIVPDDMPLPVGRVRPLVMRTLRHPSYTNGVSKRELVANLFGINL